ncbi:MAG: polyprenyl synthetase family protein [Bacteroidales bacterium]|nr:polyprenyl synthetase family protein [Bacteroidales bacterium]
MYSLNELQSIVEQNIKELSLEQEPKGLYEPIKYILSIGGKRIRPVLVLAAYNLYKDNIEDIIRPALALEVFHNFTLLHDDIMDKADVRRNQATVHKKWSENTAILSGDAMTIKAYQLISETNEKYLAAVLKAFNQTAMEVCEGQQYDMDFETRLDVREEEYIEMIRLKTSVLIAGSLQIGAIMADAPKEDIRHIYDFGVNLGLSFQLQDDYLDSFGDFNTFGKKIGNDILSNKKTFLLINALKNADKETYNQLIDLIKNTEFDPQKKIKSVLAVYKKTNTDKLHAVANGLLEFETLSGKEIEDLLKGSQPVRDNGDDDKTPSAPAVPSTGVVKPTSRDDGNTGGMEPQPSS